jgi:small subunit ribosomal protein S1
VPASQVGRERRRQGKGSTPEERWGDMVGEAIAVKVLEVDRSRNRLILSERAADRERRSERRAELIDELEVGQRRTGRVVRLTDFGAFVDLGGADGLVHLSELAWRHVDHPKDVLNAGDEIEVEVINLDKERQRIGLSRKNCLRDPWDVVEEDFRAGQLVQGRITKLTKFGAFAALIDRPEIEGLIHISELADHRVAHPRDVVNEDEVLTLRILRIEPQRRRMGLSLRQVDSAEYIDDDWEDLVSAASNKD